MDAAEILKLLQDGSLTVPNILVALEKFASAKNMTLDQAIVDAHANNADTIAAARQELGL